MDVATIRARFQPLDDDMWYDAREDLNSSDDEDCEELTRENIGLKAGQSFPFTLGKVWEQDEHQFHVAGAIRD